MQNQKTEAIPFILFTKKDGFIITEKSKKFLRTLQNKKLGIISIVGKYRTGKSYLINKLLLNTNTQKRGFTVGPTINACTKGIWIWPQTIKSKNLSEDDLELLIMDTEGFGGVKEGQNHDIRIFLFSILLSSLFIYNSLGTIDENALQNLGLIINLAKEIQKSKNVVGHSEELDEETISDIFPSFLWVLRDFSLRLVDSYNNKISSKNYLENALGLLKGNSDKIESKNNVRRLIKHFFKNRDCLTVVRPVEKESDLQRLEDLEDIELRHEFLRQIDKVRKLIFIKTPGKKLNKKYIDGNQLIYLAQAYADNINSGKSPSIELAWDYIKNFENEKVIKNIMEDLNKKRKSILNKEQAEILKCDMIKYFEKNQIGKKEDNLEIFENFKKCLDEEIKIIMERLKKNIEVEIIKRINLEFLDIKKKILSLKNLKIEDCNVIIQDEKDKIKKKYENDFNDEELEKLLKNIFSFKKNEVLGLVIKKIEDEKLKKERINEINKLKKERELQEKEKNINLKMKNMEDILTEEKKKLLKFSEVNNNLILTISNLKKNNKKLEIDNNELKKKSIFFDEKQINEKDKTIFDMKKENENLKNEKIENKKKIMLIEQELKLVKNENENLKKFLEHTEKEMNLKNIKISELEKKQKNVEKKKIIGFKEYENIKKEKENFEDLKNNYEKIIGKLSDSKIKLENEIIFLRENNQENKKENNTILQDIQKKLDLLSNNPKSKKEKKFEDLKKLKKYSTILQCANCNKFISNSIFLNHLKSCLNASEDKISQISKIEIQNIKKTAYKLDITIGQTLIRENTEKSSQNEKKNFSNQKNNFQIEKKKTYTEYILNINDGLKSWYVSRKFRDFCQLISDLQREYPYTDFPPSCKELQNFVNDIWGLIGGKSFGIETRRKILQAILKDLVCVEFFRESLVFRKFVGEIGEADLRRNGDEEKYYLKKIVC